MILAPFTEKRRIDYYIFLFDNDNRNVFNFFRNCILRCSTRFKSKSDCISKQLPNKTS